ncbi:Beta-galactosidase C-terminal domain [Rhizobium sp. NRK18]|uniref:Beta-galactosidase C-terminal domain n=1 Tax=Rhizobium sp. NRK18 TaxID=2964667 RepID=UPI0021C3EB19|nr:Beta-galactosidase C-terminal domain [Rhizobium sp. NRK18]MCQ2005273.1 Beta-galactosidase C-terminal domain [Rhizobium sp. NRK18]
MEGCASQIGGFGCTPHSRHRLRPGSIPLLPSLPHGVEVSLREAADRKLLFVLNTTAETKEVELPSSTDLLTGKAQSGMTVLSGYEVLVLEQSIQGDARKTWRG